MPRRRLLAVSVVSVLALAGFLSWPRQEGDPEFDARLAEPAFTAEGPRVYFDEGHWNMHTAAGRYKPFADLVRNDGFEVVSGKGRLTRAALRDFHVLVSANALGFGGTLQAIANNLRLEGSFDLTRSAFDQPERAEVREWIREGGAMLLVADHAPAGAASQALAEEFGIGMTNWYAEDRRHHDPETDNWGFLVFSTENNLLLGHAITRGRSERERVRKVVTFTGQALRAPAPAVPFLALSPEAIEYPRRRSPDNSFRPAEGDAQGVALEFGLGRVVVLGEAAMITSQVARGAGRTFLFGMRRPGCDNRQLALNIMRWLARVL